MKYNELLQLFFERSTALQWYWNIYVLVIGGLLAFSTLRQRRDLIKTVLITVLFACFAYKNLDAIYDVTRQRYATLKLIKDGPPDTADGKRVHDALEPTLVQATPEYDGLFGVRNFHVFCDLLTVAAVWAMEARRKKDD